VLDRDRCLRDWRTRASLVDRHVQSLFFNMAKIAASGRLGPPGRQPWRPSADRSAPHSSRKWFSGTGCRRSLARLAFACERYGGDGHGALASKWTLWKSLVPDLLGHRCKLLRRRRPSLTNARYQGAREQALHRLSPIAIWEPYSTGAAPIDRDGTKRALKRSGRKHRRPHPISLEGQESPARRMRCRPIYLPVFPCRSPCPTMRSEQR
jgi:hypothetical protein